MRGLKFGSGKKNMQLFSSETVNLRIKCLIFLVFGTQKLIATQPHRSQNRAIFDQF